MAGRDFPLKQRVFSTFKNSKEIQYVKFYFKRNIKYYLSILHKIYFRY